MNLTPRDRELLETLACPVPVLSLAQASVLFWSDTRRRGGPRRRLQRLARADWIQLRTVNAHPPLPVRRPLVAWQPGDDDPDPLRVSRLARERWSRLSRPAEICIPTKQCASAFGSTAGRTALSHLDHDLRLAAVYVEYRLHRPKFARLWIGEHALPKAGYRIKDPDAFLRDSSGRVLRVIESAGRYSAAQVESFHEHCADNQFSYELW